MQGPRPAARARRPALLATALLLLAGCAAGTVPAKLRLGGAGQALSAVLFAANRPVVTLVDVEVFELGAALLPAPRAVSTRAARDRVEAALDGLARQRQGVLLRPPREGDDAVARAGAVLREAVLAAIEAPPRSPFVWNGSPPGASRASALAPVPEASRPLAAATGAEVALLLFFRESRASETLRATNRWRLSINVPFGLSSRLFFGATSAYAVLVELATGRIVAGNGFIAAEPGPSLLDPDGAEAILGILLGERGV